MWENMEKICEVSVEMSVYTKKKVFKNQMIMYLERIVWVQVSTLLFRQKVRRDVQKRMVSFKFRWFECKDSITDDANGFSGRLDS